MLNRRFRPPHTPKLKEKKPRNFKLRVRGATLRARRAGSRYPRYLFLQKRQSLPHITSAYVPLFCAAARRLERVYHLRFPRNPLVRRVLRAAH